MDVYLNIMSIEQIVYNTRISCVICTYRRPDMFRKAVESLLAQSLPAEEYEVIVVDNNSKDETVDVVNKYIKTGRIENAI